MDRRAFLQQTLALAGTAAFSATGASASRSDPAFCFCVLADPHCSDESKKGLEALGSGLDRFFLCIDSMKALPEADRPAFVLVAGDIHIQALAPHLDRVGIPLKVTPGNHEADRETRDLLHTLFPGSFRVDGKPADYYSFVHQGVRFISVCDAGKGGEHIGQMCSEIITPSGQCEWLEKELALPEERKVLFAHIPLQRDGKDEDMFLSRNDSRWMRALLEKTQPDAIFFGHLHRKTESYLIGKTKVVQLRSACWNFGQAPIGYMHVRVTGAGMETREIITGRYA